VRGILRFAQNDALIDVILKAKAPAYRQAGEGSNEFQHCATIAAVF